MRLQRTLLSVLALAATLVSCSSDDTDSGNGGPASVKKLETPKNRLSVSMLLLDPAEFEGLRFEWQSAGDGVSYELAFDKNGGDFSAPVASFTTSTNSHTLQLEEIQQLFDENVDEAGESAVLDWRVYTTSDAGRFASAETRTLTLTTRAEVVVETLITPENEALFNLTQLTEDVTFQWSKPVWLGNEKLISYTFVIDRADKDFSEPLVSVDLNPSEEAAAATQTVVTKEKLSELYSASDVAATEDAYNLKWVVYAKIDKNVKISEEVRTFSIIPKKKIGAFAEGDTLYIGIPESSEDGQKASFINDGYYRTDNDSWHDRLEKVGQNWNDFPYYEIFTRLEAGEKYGFYAQSDDNEKIHFFKAASAEGFVETESEEESYTSVESSGIYRIRFKADGTNKIDIRKVEYINLRFAWGDYGQNNYTDAAMNYAGKGLWTLPSYHIVLRDMGTYKEDRYRFVMKLEGIDQVQGLSKNNEGLVTSERPGQSENSSYWYLQLSYTGWDFWVFKYPAWLCDDSNLGKWAADVNLYMNADKGHYTHEFVNPVEVKSFADGDALYIDGSGTEAGQKMSYITADSYNTQIGNSGEVDKFKNEDYKYEIFTRIEGGSKFYFRSQFSDALYTLSEDGTQVKQIESTDEAEAPIAETGIYRIRFNIASGKAYIASIDYVAHFFCWTSVETEMAYEGKGVWVIKDLNIWLQKTDWGFDERYKFKFIIDGEAQPYGRMDSNGNRPNASTASSYWYVQPSTPSQWDPAFKYPDELCDVNDLDRWYADLRLYMNDDKGHYTHEFTNAHE